MNAHYVIVFWIAFVLGLKAGEWLERRRQAQRRRDNIELIAAACVPHKREG